MTLPAFIESPRFPSLLGWEYSIEPIYEVDVIPRGSDETRLLRAKYPRRRITITIPDDKQADIIAIDRWHHAVRGKAIGFRVRNPMDYLSISLDPYQDIGRIEVEAEVSRIDQPLLEIAADPGTYQLIKRYRLEGDAGDLDQDLPIRKPIVSTIVVANQVGALQADTRYDLDEETGILAPNSTFVGTPATWGGAFDLPMRFETGLPVQVRNMRVDSVTFSLYELRP